MESTKFGDRDNRGGWKPSKRLAYPPVFVWPVQPAKFMKWLLGFPGYLMPWNAFYLILSVALWNFLTPSMATMETLSWEWASYLLVRNWLIVLLFYGSLHFRLYSRKKQSTSFKYNSKWPTKESSAFLFKNQTVDNIIWTMASAVPVWTTFEVLILWLGASDHLMLVSIKAHPIYCVLLFLLIPLWRDLHFYLTHRAIHWRPLYKSIHKLHHNNVNPGPWSGLAMHPVEHVVYFSVALVVLFLPFHPIHLIFILIHTVLAPAPGHAGFDKVIVGKKSTVNISSYAHYLHHKYFECNYGDGVIPLDRWFGTFHDGSADSQKKNERSLKEKAR